MRLRLHSMLRAVNWAAHSRHGIRLLRRLHWRNAVLACPTRRRLNRITRRRRPTPEIVFGSGIRACGNVLEPPHPWPFARARKIVTIGPGHGPISPHNHSRLIIINDDRLHARSVRRIIAKAGVASARQIGCVRRWRTDSAEDSGKNNGNEMSAHCSSYPQRIGLQFIRRLWCAPLNRRVLLIVAAALERTSINCAFIFATKCDSNTVNRQATRQATPYARPPTQPWP